VAHLTYLDRVSRALYSIKVEEVTKFVDLLVRARAANQLVLIVGNGGSATTASHMATDLGVGSQRFGAGIRVTSLVDNAGVITATGNDLSYDDIFSAQVQLLGQPGDVLVAISASGNSQNLIAAAAQAHQLGMKVVGITGFTGGRLAEMADLSIHVVTDVGDYGPAEDAHLVVNHMVTELLRQRLGGLADARNLHG
jgi:D-sedoheptulose 7-phosphate isomerase